MARPFLAWRCTSREALWLPHPCVHYAAACALFTAQALALTLFTPVQQATSDVGEGENPIALVLLQRQAGLVAAALPEYVVGAPAFGPSDYDALSGQASYGYAAVSAQPHVIAAVPTAPSAPMTMPHGNVSYGYNAIPAHAKAAAPPSALRSESSGDVSHDYGVMGVLEASDAALPYNAAADDTQLDVSSDRGIILRYMPARNAAVCACAKCGSTSLWSWLYESEFGHPFLDASEKEPDADVQEVEGAAWHGLFHVIRRRDGQDAVMKSAFSFALIRDPKERLISAWKSKVACGGRKHYGTNIGHRAGIVRELLRTAGKETKEECLSLDRFMEVLYGVHMDGNDYLLNGHFLPQNKACFAHAAPDRWSAVADISSPAPFTQLASRLGTQKPPTFDAHSSNSQVLVTKRVADILSVITAQEYETLGPYLSRPSRVVANEYVLSEGQLEGNIFLDLETGL